MFLYLFNRDCLIRGIRRDCFINRILGEFLNQIVNGCDFVDLPRISTGKYQTMIDISADGTDQCHGDAVGGSSRIAGLQAVEAVGDRNSVLAESFDKRIQQSASRHMDRTLNDGNIAFLCFDVHILKRIRSIAFLGSNKARSHLYAGKTQREVVFNVLLIENAAAENNGDFLVEFLFKFFDDIKNFLDFLS